jgi:hypothetical protein
MKFVLLLFICTALSCNTTTYLYTNSLFHIQVPNGWVLKENELDYMPIRVYEDNGVVMPNYNITLLNNDKKITEIVSENESRNCLQGACHISSLKKKKKDGQEFFESYQDITIDGQRVIIKQYYFEAKNTVFLLSFFYLKRDSTRIEALFEQIVDSFVIKV